MEPYIKEVGHFILYVKCTIIELANYYSELQQKFCSMMSLKLKCKTQII